MMISRLTIRARLMLLGAVALGGVLVSSVFGILQLAAFNAEQIGNLGDIRDSNALTLEVRAAEAELKNQGREWKNLLLRGSDPASFEGHKKAFFEAEKRTLEVIRQAAETMKKANHPRQGVLEEATRMHGDLGKLYGEVIAKWDANDPDNARKGDDALKGKDRPLAEALGKLVGDISQEQKEGIERQMRNSEAFYESARNIFLGVLAVSAAIVLLLVSLTVTTISRQVSTLSETLERIRGDLDLSSRLPAAGSDEISLTAQNVNALLDEFQSTVRQMKGGAGQVAQASQQLSQSVGQLSGAVAQQHDATSSMAASIEELAASVGQVANSSATAQNISVDSRDHAIRGGEVIDKTTGIMAQMADSVRSTAETIADLQRHSQEIDSIAGTIKEIADQTNLLALNAAIEAARAGESGRGFAVVADEVRKLAERTTKATAEIAKVIETIQTNTLKAVGDMESVVVQARDNAALVSQAGEAIVAIRRGSGEVVEVTNGIATAIKEQSSASNLLAQQIERVANMSETNSATLSQVKEASIEMNQLSDEMRRMAERFRV